MGDEIKAVIFGLGPMGRMIARGSSRKMA